MASDKERKIFDAVYRQVKRLVDRADRIYVALYDPRTVRLEFLVAGRTESGFPPELRNVRSDSWKPRPYQPDRLLPDWLLADAERGSRYVADDFERWLSDQGLDYPYPEPLPRSWLGIPFVVRGRGAAVLVLESKRENAFDEDTRTWLGTLVKRASATLTSTYLIERFRTVNMVGQTLSAGVGRDMGEILDLIHEQAGELMDARDMYVALYDAGRQMLGFPAAWQDGERRYWPSRTVEVDERGRIVGGGLTEEVLRRGQAVRVPNFVRWYEERGLAPPIPPYPKSWLGVPLKAGGRVLGVVAVQNDEIEDLYSPDDEELLAMMAGQAATAIRNSRLVESQEAVNEVGRILTRNIRRGPEEILQTIYEQAGRPIYRWGDDPTQSLPLLDTRDMYVALYDADKQELSFPLAYMDGKKQSWPSRRVDIDDETQGGLTEAVLRSRKPLSPSDVQAWYDERGLKPAIEPLPKSWLGVPLTVGERVLGVIALQNDEVENLYGPEDARLLQTMADQAAVALENARLYANMEQEVEKRTKAWELERERADAAEKLALMSNVAAEFAHRMNNLAGTIPVRVRMAKEKLAANDPAGVQKQLDSIAEDAKLLLEAAREIKESTEKRAAEPVDVNELLDIALGRVKNSKPDMEGRIRVEWELTDGLPRLYAERNRLLDTLVSIIRNGVEAIAGEGVLTLSTRLGTMKGKSCLEIGIADTGKGIPPADLPKIFDLFFTTKEKGLGFGLWRDRMFVKELGGDIEVDSVVGRGTTFTIKIPLSADASSSEGGQNG